MTPRALLTLALILASAGLARGQDDPSSDMARGDYYFKAGYYLKASESYRVAIIDQPRSEDRLLAFANALFALGNYHYSSHALRRAIALHPRAKPFTPQVAQLFPNRLSYIRALDDLKRYVTYNRRDPSALTVLAYTYFAEGDDEKANKICGYLRLLDREDVVAAFILDGIARRSKDGFVPSGESSAVQPEPPPEPQAAPQPAAPQPAAPQPAAPQPAAPRREFPKPPELPEVTGVPAQPEHGKAQPLPAISD